MHQLAQVVAFERRQLETLKQQQGMFAAGLRTFRVDAEGIRIGADLIGDEREQQPRRLLIDAQKTTGISRQTELHGKTESILFAATCLYQLQVFVNRFIMTKPPASARIAQG